jgi:TPR repeat protein
MNSRSTCHYWFRILCAISALGVICTLSPISIADEGVEYRPLFKRGTASDRDYCYAATRDASRWHDGDPEKQVGVEHCWDFMSVDGKYWTGSPLPLGKKEHQEGNYLIYTLQANLFDYKAAYYVAREARVGRVSNVDLSKAFQFTEKLAKRRHTKAQYLLGLHYAEGHGVYQDYDEALRWLNRAMAGGDVDAKVYLAYLYEVGKGVDKDRKKAAELYREGARQQHPFALASIDRISQPESITAELVKNQQTGMGSSSGTKSAQTESVISQEESTGAIELSFWETIKDSAEPEMFKEYLRQFPAGIYAGLARIKLKLLGDDPTEVVSSVPNLDYGNYHALIIGNNNYETLPNLRSAVNDAKAVSTLLDQDYGFKVTTLVDAKRADVLRGLAKLRQSIGEEDNILIYYAGHGWLDEEADEGFWLPVDARQNDPSNWIMTDRVVAQIRAMQAKHVMVVADSCFSGTITRAIRIDQRTPDYLQKIVQTKSRTALTSGGLEPVLDSGGGRHSVFARSFISLLENNKGVLDGSTLFSDLRQKVMDNAAQTPQYGNIHQAGHDGGDFLFVRR